MGYRQDWKNIILKDAPKHGVTDPRAALAVAMMEGLSGAVGDGGHAFGPFQMNDAGGVITGRPGNHRAYAESRKGIDDALDQIGKVSHGLSGAQAINAIVRRFERPAAPDPEVAGAINAYGQGGGNAPGAVPQMGGFRSQRKPASGGNSGNPDMRQMLLATLMQGNVPSVAPGASPSILPLLLAGRMSQGSPGSSQAVSGPPVRSGGPSRGGTAPVTGEKVSFEGDLTGEKPHFVNALQQALASVGGTHVRISSGYRSPEHNKAVGGAAHSNHTTGDAMDGEVFIPGKGWVPLGTALKNVAPKFGLRSGASFNWNGRPDVVHVDDALNQR